MGIFFLVTSLHLPYQKFLHCCIPPLFSFLAHYSTGSILAMYLEIFPLESGLGLNLGLVLHIMKARFSVLMCHVNRFLYSSSSSSKKDLLKSYFQHHIMYICYRHLRMSITFFTFFSLFLFLRHTHTHTHAHAYGSSFPLVSS